jgi:hypothetical protein
MSDHNALLMAWSSPASAEQAEEFHTWYEGTHVPEVRANVPGIVDVRRYTVVDPAAADGGPGTRFLAVYFLRTDDLATAAGALGNAMAGGRLTMSAAMDAAGDPPVLQWATAR